MLAAWVVAAERAGSWRSGVHQRHDLAGAPHAAQPGGAECVRAPAALPAALRSSSLPRRLLFRRRRYEDFNSDVAAARTPCPYNAAKLYLLSQDNSPCPIHPFVLARRVQPHLRSGPGLADRARRSFGNGRGLPMRPQHAADARRHHYAPCSAFANGNMAGPTGPTACIVGGNANYPDCYTPAGAAVVCSGACARRLASTARAERVADRRCWCALAGVGSQYNCYFGGQTMANEHLLFPPLPNNTNGNFPSWNGLGGQFDPLWYNSQGAVALRTCKGFSSSSEHVLRAHRLQLPLVRQDGKYNNQPDNTRTRTDAFAHRSLCRDTSCRHP
jgi:hypothetical protein